MRRPRSHFPAFRHLKDVRGPFHSGEREVQRRAGVEEEAGTVGRIIGRTLTPPATRFLARQRLALAASVDPGGRVWASLLTGPAGFLAPKDPAHLLIATEPIPGDPLRVNLEARTDLGLLVLDPWTRQRVRLSGRGALVPEGVLLDLDQVYGNCPKYIQRREPKPDVPGASGPPRVAARLDARQRAWIGNADTLFIGSFHREGGADASHRGGFPGFVRVIDDGALVFPDYPGNAMFNTLGNLVEYPQAGLLFVGFETGDILQVTGRARLGPDFAVRIDLDEVRETRAASPLRFRLIEFSPAIPSLSHDHAAAHLKR